MKLDIDISMGPVQGFVAQSRRTRDLWGSSYLLSYLAAQAIRGAIEAGGSIVRPRVNDDPMLGWVTRGRGGTAPELGGTPNHFSVRTEGEPRAVVSAVTAAFRDAWRQVHDAVWDRFIQEAAHLGNGTRDIWERQVDGCWELVWVAGPAGEAGGLLARRKHWRTHRLPDEPGDKCTVMPDFQELSGCVKSSAAQQRFWTAIRGEVGVLELRGDERLCAPAVVKRLFARCADEAIGGALDADHWPSTVYIGAVPWLHRVAASARPEAKAYVGALRAAAPREVVRRQKPVEALRGAEPRDFMRLDANYYHRAFLATPRICELTDPDPAMRRRLGELLEEVNRAAEGPPPVYYALLLADGDKLGALVGDVGPEQVGTALSTFGGDVKDIVTAHDGVTLYAGGDDVLVMLPADRALGSADRLASAYEQAFQRVTHKPATLSAAVVFAHVRMPVGGVLDAAHTLLDDVAKDANDRASIVAAVLKPSAPYCQWVTKWRRAYGNGREDRAVAQVQGLGEAMTSEAGGRELSASLLYQLRETIESLGGLSRWRPGSTGALPERLDLAMLVRAELVDSWDGRADDGDTRLSDLTQLVADLVSVSPGGGPAGHAGMDALLLARFLASGGREEEHG
jgi:CRISPR-associated protein Cmr2